MVSLGRDRYHHKVKRAKETSLESTTAVGQHLLAESIELMSDALKEWLKSAAHAPGKRHRAFPFLQDIPVDVTSALTARCILDCISIERKIASTAITIGRLLEDELKFRKIKAEEPALWNQINRVLDRYKSQKTKSKFINRTIKFHKVVVPQWSRQEAASVGLTCIELLRQSTGIIETITRRDAQGRSYTIVRPTDELMAWMKNSHEFKEALNPVWLPMVEKPVDWNNVYIGGYHSINYRRRPLIKTHDVSYLEEANQSEMPEVYGGVNMLQGTPFNIDGQMLELLNHCWDRGLPIGGVPSLDDDPVPNKPADIGSNAESRRQWRKAAARTHFENERQKSKRLQVMKVLNLAKKFFDDDLYFVHQLDFRARGYPVPYFLQPQGTSYVQSLMNFSRGEPLDDDGTMWLYISAASKWGLDKKSYPERLRWAEDNINMIRRIGESPIEDKTWADADDPWHFARLCVEINRMHKEGGKFKSNLPVSLDATNQGHQIYAMLLRDVVGGVLTNVVPGDLPQDLYGRVATAVIEKLRADSNPYAAIWLEFGVDRKTTKRPTMTLTYGSTFFSCRTYTTEWFYDRLKSGIPNPFKDETYKPCNYLAEKIWESIGEAVHSARVGMDWLKESAQIMVDNGVTPRWVSPLGFPVKMYYENTNKYAVKTLVGGTLRQHRLRIPNGVTNRRKTVNAICPNVVHTLDGIGGLLGLTLSKLLQRGVKDARGVHDSVGVHARSIETLQSCVREATVEIFSENQLEILSNQFAVLLPSGVSLPSLPEMGTLDVADVLRSKYYFNP